VIDKQQAIDWIIKQHNDTNHMYDEYLPYEFHLRMVNEVRKKFQHILPRKLFMQLASHTLPPENITDRVIELACFGHDLQEDTRATYNDIYKVLGKDAAEIIRAVTNYGRGRNRDERMPDFVYEDICNTPGATFVKLCDRIANVQYGKMMGSSMFTKYKNENEHFLTKLGLVGLDEGITTYYEMVTYLNNLFND